MLEAVHTNKKTPRVAMNTQASKNSFVRVLLVIAGWLSVCLGVVGIVLPVLPTTPFMILAALCFSRSSPRFHSWLLNNRIFGPIISDWQSNKCMRKKVKMRALVIIAITFFISIMIVPLLWVKGLLLCCWLVCCISVWRVPVCSCQ